MKSIKKRSLVILRKILLRNKGFGLIEMLISLVVVCVLAVMATRIIKKMNVDTGSQNQTIKNEFLDAIERSGSIILEEAGAESFEYSNDSSNGGFRLDGMSPFHYIERLENNEWTRIADNVSYMKFTYYNRSGGLIFDEDAQKEPAKIGKIRVLIMQHDGEEVQGQLNYKSKKSIDLDGDLSNGKAELREISFSIHLN